MGFSSDLYKDYLIGMWEGNEEFLKKSSLNNFQLLISNLDDTIPNAYLIITNYKDELLSNQKITLSLSDTKIKKQSNKKPLLISTVNIKQTKDIDILPNDLTLTASIFEGTLILHNDEKIFALLEKNIKLTNLS